VRELFIYYRIAGKHAPAAHVAVLDFQARLRARWPGLSTQLYKRNDDSMDLQTWMETYALRGPDGAGIEARLEREIDAEALCMTPFISGTRHTEVFVPCAS